MLESGGYSSHQVDRLVVGMAVATRGTEDIKRESTWILSRWGEESPPSRGSAEAIAVAFATKIQKIVTVRALVQLIEFLFA